MGRPAPLPGLIQAGAHLTWGAAALADEAPAEAAAAPAAWAGSVRFARMTRLLEADPVSRGALY